jgi:inorganic triphosphatase YgiF
MCRRDKMPEVEIKLQVAAHQLAAVRASLSRGRCAATHLHACYCDTPDRSLAAAGYVLRLRREGRRWVQAIKGPGDSVLSRNEHEVVVGVGAGVPAVDVQRHAGAPGFDRFATALGERPAALAPVFEIDVRRTHRVVRSQGATIDIALDVGRILCAGAALPVCELEFELESGSLAALTQLAGRWAVRHGLWLDVRSKAERGGLLARGEAASPAERGKPPVLAPDMAPEAALRRCVHAALAQVLPNAAALAAGSGGADHVHQARVGLRRALSVLREFGAWSTALDPEWSTQLAQVFRALGQARDRDVLAGWLLPELQRAGAPPLAGADPAAATDPGEALRSPGATRCLIELLGFACAEPMHDAAQADGQAPDLLERARSILARLHRRLRRAGKAFATLDDAQRHRARKQLKRLRYCAESLSSLFPPRAWQRYAARLRAAQDALGRLQDLSLAETTLRAQTQHDPSAWFALGWLAARRPAALADAAAALSALGKRPAFLR